MVIVLAIFHNTLAGLLSSKGMAAMHGGTSYTVFSNFCLLEFVFCHHSTVAIYSLVNFWFIW